ncbi:class E sortase [Streptomyces sp. NBC_00620]|uniref:class E sortase n=1 Tax=Streptomyces sp. NBC_00620 TaxID=2903666 RepID=UPI002252B7A0|nr:class E sortase [Streptomyces sp. NBC_00620]MCX4974126.1 class E sortase [Streptomyces sp. NBC_00620]
MRVTRAARVSVVRHSTRRRQAMRRRALWTGGELLVTLGVVLLLLVAHQLWWTNRQAQHNAAREVQALEREWGAATPSAPATEAAPSAAPTEDAGQDSDGQERKSALNSTRTQPSWSQAYAILTIPRLGLRVPVAEGVSKQGVLNKGYVGHYKDTQQPGQAGNFALAGHRNTHGEPFRYINRLKRGDEISVETEAALYTYTVDKTLPQTSAGDGGVIGTVPRSTARPAYGYSEPGYYISLTTCTPEYTSKYRLVVWGKLTSTRPK